MSEGYDLQQLMFRNQHGGIRYESIRINHERTARARIRATPDKRLFDSMSSEQEGAFEKIYTAFMFNAAGTTCKAMDYSKASGSGISNPDETYIIDLTAKYKNWYKACIKKYGIRSVFVCIEIIIDGLSPNQVETKRQMRNGSAKETLLECLDVWGKV